MADAARTDVQGDGMRHRGLLAIFVQTYKVSAGEQGWKLIDTGGPPPRHSPGMAYDSSRGVVVMFGGFAGRERDPVRGVVVLFGGIPRHMGDTWERDGVEWRQVAGSGPSGRSRSAMVYDEARGALILFGGRLQDGTALGDTWAWDGKEWKFLTENIDFARSRHGMVYDRARRAIVAHGVAFNGRNEMIEWDGSHWERIYTAVPPSRIYYGLIYHDQRSSIIMFGGWDGAKPLGEKWEFKYPTP